MALLMILSIWTMMTL